MNRHENCACWFLMQHSGFVWFLKLMRGNRPLKDWFYPDFNLLYCFNESKSWRKPQIEAKYIRKYNGESLLSLASALIKPKWGKSDNCAITSLSGSSIPSRWFLRHACSACNYSHVCRWNWNELWSEFFKNLARSIVVVAVKKKKWQQIRPLSNSK
jgi:hypothetical protein